MSSLTLHHCHFHRAEHPFGQGGNSNYLKGGEIEGYTFRTGMIWILLMLLICLGLAKLTYLPIRIQIGAWGDFV